MELSRLYLHVTELPGLCELIHTGVVRPKEDIPDYHAISDPGETPCPPEIPCL
jgi:hypothetical protein